MNRRYGKSGLVIALVVIMAIISHTYSENYRVASENLRDLYFAISAAMIGLFLHFFKNYSKIKNNQSFKMMADSFELLMLIIAPVFTSFRILKEEFPGNPNPMILLSTIAIFLWYIITLIRTSGQKEQDAGRAAFAISSLLYAGLLAMIGMVVWLVILYSPR